MSRRIRLLVAVALGAAAACPLHDLAAALETGRATAAGPHEWPYAAACAAFANTTAFNAMALLVNVLFAGRDFNCKPLAHSAQCSDGDAVVEIFGFDSIAEHWEKALGIIVLNYVVARLLFLGLLVRAARRPAPKPLDDRPNQRFYNIGKAFVELKRRELGHRRRRGDTVDDDDGRSPDSVLFGAPRFGARLPARFGDGRSAESEELLSIDGSAPTSPV